MKRGQTKNKRHLESRDVQAFVRVLRNVFPGATEGDMSEWCWADINTKRNNRERVVSLMMDYRDLDPQLFRSWDFHADDVVVQRKLSTALANLRKSVAKYEEINKNK